MLTKLTNAYILFMSYLLWIKMSTIHDLDRLVRKGVRTKDGNDLGNIIAVDGSNMTIQGRKMLKIPSTYIDFYNGSEVFLTLDIKEAFKYKI